MAGFDTPRHCVRPRRHRPARRTTALRGRPRRGSGASAASSTAATCWRCSAGRRAPPRAARGTRTRWRRARTSCTRRTRDRPGSTVDGAAGRPDGRPGAGLPGRRRRALRRGAGHGGRARRRRPGGTACRRCELPRIEACPRLPVQGPGFEVPLMAVVAEHLDPAVMGWAVGRPSGAGELRGWAAFADGRDPDPLALLMLVDALPPATFDLGSTGWVPTLELTCHVRAAPAPGPLAVRQRVRHVVGRPGRRGVRRLGLDRPAGRDRAPARRPADPRGAGSRPPRR